MRIYPKNEKKTRRSFPSRKKINHIDLHGVLLTRSSLLTNIHIHFFISNEGTSRGDKKLLDSDYFYLVDPSE